MFSARMSSRSAVRIGGQTIELCTPRHTYFAAALPSVTSLIRQNVRRNSTRISPSVLSSPVSSWSIIRPRKTLRIQQQRCASSASNDTSELRRTALYDLHKEHGGKMVPFGGYEMPVQYSDLSISESHLWTREKASLFDVGHMVQHMLRGPGAQGFLERLTPASLASLPPHHSTLTCLLLPKTGGIVDDSVVTRIGPETFYFVTNAGRRDADLAYLADELAAFRAESDAQQVDWEVLEGQGLIALQGPKAAEILAPLVGDAAAGPLDDLYFGQSRYMAVTFPDDGTQSAPVLVSRAGYTGEDGFEISVAAQETERVARALLDAAGPEALRLAGLGARDSLRLEAGMCLYGHDIDEATTPVEAALSWVVGKDRRAPGGFHGSEVVLRQLTPKKDGGTGTQRRRVGLVVEGAPAREGAEIVDAAGERLGVVTSGCPSPSLGKNIAMGYVKTGHQKAGTEVGVVVRGRQRKATVTKMPFVPAKYYKGPGL